MKSSSIRSLADQFGIDFFDTIDPGFFVADFVSKIPLSWARNNSALPAKVAGDAVLFIPGPDSFQLLQQASFALGVELKAAFAPAEEILKAIEVAYFTQSSSSTLTPEAPSDVVSAATQSADANPLRTDSGSADLLAEHSGPVEKFLNSTLLEAIRLNASDVHFEPESEGGARVRFRLSGQLYDQPVPPRGLAAQVVSRIKVMASMDIAEHRLPQDGMAQVKVGGKAIDIRVSILPAADGERAVLRLLRRDNSLLSLSALGMGEGVLNGFSQLVDSPNGIIVVSGPTGSGKTTTLYSALGSLDCTRRNVMTIEDPIEYKLAKIAQMQVKPKIGLTFASGLRHILRQDPDVVLVGETRDAETAEIAIRASLTGHLVFTTLHTNDSASAVVRFCDMGIAPYLLASSLRGVLAQRLVRQVCPHCARQIEFDASGVSALEAAVARKAGCGSVLQAVGCDKCLEGFCGRVGIFELLTCTAEISDFIHQGGYVASALQELASKTGALHAIKADAFDKLSRFVTTPSEVLSTLGKARLLGE